MKPYKFLIPIGIAAGALAGNAAKADTMSQPEAKIEQLADASATEAAQNLLQKYVANGEENTLLLNLGNQGVAYAHDSHASHASHASHSSHSSHSSHTSGM